MNQPLFESGTFFVGCNYWASHAGIFMWRDWRPEVVEEDFKRLAEANIHVLRIFPLWPDFQPLKMHRAACGEDCEIRLREEPLPFTEAGKAGVDPVVAGRFRDFLHLAEKYEMKLIVGLLTGWMSGRMFVPELLEKLDPLTDARAIKWEVKFVRYMVRNFREEKAVVAWDLGNECNCMGRCASAEQSYVWASTITMAIQAEDRSHPVISGMHSLLPDGTWRMQDQGEFLDILTTHPYPIFTPHCNTDPINRMKSALHPAAQTCLYADLGGIPCFAEETGTIGPMISSEKIAADYVRSALFTLWAHNGLGFLWWCANEQSELTQTPYDWCAVERELGLFRQDHSKKPVLDVLTAFSRFPEQQGLAKLPEQATDAVCVLTHDQDTWAAAYGAFILAKQAGMNLRFVYCDQELPQAGAYLLPSLKGTRSLSRHVQAELLERAAHGAVLYLSIDDALLSPFTAFTGLEVQTREVRTTTDTVLLHQTELQLPTECSLHLASVGAEVLAENQNGEPAFTVNAYGAGKVYFLNYPIEKLTASVPGMVDGPDAQPLFRFYQALGIRKERLAEGSSRTVGLTEHRLSDTEAALILVNYEPEAQNVKVRLAAGWKAVQCGSLQNDCEMCDTAEGFAAVLAHNSGAVIRIRKNS